jgi:probable rRNA maturation factor
MISVYKNNISLFEITKPKIQSIATNVLTHLGHLDSDLTVYLTDNHHIQKLNKQYRGIDAPTDVLSFSYNEKYAESDKIYLGDIIISLEYARLEAVKKGCNLLDEVKLLIVHGVLHLSGYNHGGLIESKEMSAKQAEILSYLNR